MYLNRLNMKCFFSTRQKQANNSQFPPHHTCELMITSHTFDMFSWIWCPVFDLSSKCVQVPVDILQESFSSSSGQGTCLQKQFSPFWLKHKSTLYKVPLKDISISFTVSVNCLLDLLSKTSLSCAMLNLMKYFNLNHTIHLQTLLLWHWPYLEEGLLLLIVFVDQL